MAKKIKREVAMGSYSPRGYAWLGVDPEKGSTALLEEEKADIQKHIFLLDKRLYALTNKLNRLEDLSKKYEANAATERGAGILKQMKFLKKEIDSISKEILEKVDEIITLCSQY